MQESRHPDAGNPRYLGQVRYTGGSLYWRESGSAGFGVRLPARRILFSSPFRSGPAVRLPLAQRRSVAASHLATGSSSPNSRRAVPDRRPSRELRLPPLRAARRLDARTPGYIRTRRRSRLFAPSPNRCSTTCYVATPRNSRFRRNATRASAFRRPGYASVTSGIHSFPRVFHRAPTALPAVFHGGCGQAGRSGRCTNPRHLGQVRDTGGSSSGENQVPLGSVERLAARPDPVLFAVPQRPAVRLLLAQERFDCGQSPRSRPVSSESRRAVPGKRPSRERRPLPQVPLGC
jgi:hypothetical protein